MPDLYLVLDLIVVIALVILGVTVLLKNKNLELNRTFALFVLCVSVWITANYISNDIKHSAQTAVIANYFVLSFSYGAAICLTNFAITLADDKKAKRLLRKLYVPLLLIAASAATPLVVKGAVVQEKVYAVTFGPLAPLYFVTLIMVILSSVYVVRRNIKRSTGNQQGRLKVLFKSLYWTFPVLLLALVVLPATTGWFGLTNIGVLPMLILVFGLYYGAVKHRMFDLRLVIVRLLAYGLSLGLVAVMYGVVSHEISIKASAITGKTAWGSVLNIAVIIILILSYQPLKRAFDRFTNRFFYQDAYDPQLMLDQLNRVVINNVETNSLLEGVTAIIQEYLKTEFCYVELKETVYQPRRIIGSTMVLDQGKDDPDIYKIQKLMVNQHQRVIVTDEMEESDKRLFKTLQDANIAVLCRLTPSLNYDDDGIGFLVMGSKKSGNQYNKQDINVMNIIASELIIAIQNVLRFEEIENFNITLQEQIDKATNRLQKTNDKLKQMDETKDEFISMASHQLRTPLTSVKGYLSMVLEGDAGELNEMQQKLLGQAFISSQRMVFLIADLLNVSRLRTGKFIIEAKPTNLADVVEGEVSQLHETAEGRSVELVYEKPKTFPTLMMDETKLRQVVMNFMDNAIYYTPAGGHIEVHLKDTKDAIEFTVKDDGMGVPQHEQHHLFSKFYRAGNARKARPDGTGLGLFMAKKVVIAQGGTLIFKSKEGHGSTFGFSFSKAHLAAQPAASPQSVVNHSHLNETGWVTK